MWRTSDLAGNLLAARRTRWDAASHRMKLSGIDANLLVALNALLRERNVTRAAARLGIGQPGLSHSLARLREHFKDPLLIANGRELVLSERALKLVEPVAKATAALAEVFEERPAFDPQMTSRSFIASSTDVFAWRFVPSILRAFSAEAPGAELEIRALITRSSEQILSDGVELAFGVFEDLPPEINQQPLFQERYACIVRADHPQVGKTLTLETYVKLAHVEVAPAPHSRPGMRIDRMLAAKGLRRTVVARVPYFLLGAKIIAQSDLVLTTTEGNAKELMSLANVRVLEPPLRLPTLQFSQIWHRKVDVDQAHRWLRDLCAKACV